MRDDGDREIDRFQEEALGEGKGEAMNGIWASTSAAKRKKPRIQMGQGRGRGDGLLMFPPTVQGKRIASKGLRRSPEAQGRMERDQTKEASTESKYRAMATTHTAL